MASSTTNLAVAVLLLSSCLALSRSEEARDGFEKCQPFPCGRFGNLTYPFEDMRQHKKCGFLSVDGCNERVPKFQFTNGTGNWYDLLDIYPNKTIHVRDQELERQLMMNSTGRCRVFNNLNPLYSSLNIPFTPIRIYPTIDLLRCNRTAPALHSDAYPTMTCGEYNIYYISKPMPDIQPQSCSIIQLPANQTGGPSISKEWFHRIVSDFLLESPDELCQYASDDKFKCASQKNTGNGGNRRIKQWIGIGVGCSAVAALITVFIFRRYRQKSPLSGFHSMEKDSHLSSKLDFERDSAYFGVPIFAYTELEQATNYFHPTRELGDGGYGTVYYGELRDGREIAVKRLYENNYKLVQQFINEIKIITQLCHKNLVTLYGCTSRHCRELLLVYEFIPNGTVADNLRRDRATLAWPVRLRIATETANALTYLHASGIIHRDIKTSNILLDNHFSVKVADFGLSRVFPTDVTHVSTAPQGTPGYVDPEYHKCYQLTEKSDVYSFGVVLIQLITSLPAVDISRERDEINLAAFAVNRIQNGEFSDFLDPCLCLGSDMAGRKMVTLVSELAFQCLQSDRDHRPSMEEVLRFLKSIGGELDGAEVGAPVDDNTAMALKGNSKTWSESHDGVLSKGTHSPTSPISVSYMSCCSGSTTASSSFTR